MPKIGKFLLIFGVGLAIFVIAGVASVDKEAGINLWAELAYTFMLYSFIAAIVGGSFGNSKRFAGGLGTFFVGFVLFGLIGGIFIINLPLVFWLCFFSSIIYGYMVGKIPVKE